jgi:hypothetical protein
MHKFLQLTFCASLLLTLAACQQGSAPDTSNEATSSSSIAKSAMQSKHGELITTVPSTLSACTPSSEVTVKWDAQSAKVANVEVWVGSGTKYTLFAAGGSKGEAKTGLWVVPGAHFELKDKSTGKVIGETVVGGPNCPQN